MAMELNPEVKQQLLIRVPAEAVYNAFADPEITTQFWFSHSDGRLETGAKRLWEWRMFGCSTKVDVIEATPHSRILIEWGEPPRRSSVEWTFESRAGDSTLVTVRNFELSGSTEEVVAEAIESMGGFSLVLASCKALLEHDVQLNVIADHAPDALVDGSSQSAKD